MSYSKKKLLSSITEQVKKAKYIELEIKSHIARDGRSYGVERGLPMRTDIKFPESLYIYWNKEKLAYYRLSLQEITKLVKDNLTHQRKDSFETGKLYLDLLYSLCSKCVKKDKEAILKVYSYYKEIKDVAQHISKDKTLTKKELIALTNIKNFSEFVGLFVLSNETETFVSNSYIAKRYDKQLLKTSQYIPDSNDERGIKQENLDVINQLKLNFNKQGTKINLDLKQYLKGGFSKDCFLNGNGFTSKDKDLSLNLDTNLKGKYLMSIITPALEKVRTIESITEIKDVQGMNVNNAMIIKGKDNLGNFELFVPEYVTK